MLPDVASVEEFWMPLVDEPIGTIVAEIQEERPEIAALVDSPRRLLAFRTFAYIRVGILLGRLLVEHDVKQDESASWAEQLAQSPEHHEKLVREVLAVAEEVAADPVYARELLGPSDEERQRFSEFAKRRLAADS
jgi:hypothetical protein